jgi:predicted ester cyclase
MMQLGVMPAPEPLDPALLVPSFTLPDVEPSGLSPVEAGTELDAHWDAHNLSACAKGIHPDAEILMIPLGVPIDREGFIALSELEFLGFPDIRWEPVRSIDMGDGWVVTEIVTTGTHNGPYMGIPATGRSLTLRAAVLRRFNVDGLITNLHLYYDNMTLLQQLTAPEFQLAGAWVERIPPWENVVDPGIALHKLTPLDPEGNRLLYTVKFVNEVASLPGVPAIDYVSQFIGEAVKTGLNTYEYTVVCYAATHQDEPGQRRGQVKVIATITGRAEMLGPDQRYDTQMYKWFTADQDVDPADGFPDAGQEPVLTLGPFAGDAFTRVPLVPLPEGP